MPYVGCFRNGGQSFEFWEDLVKITSQIPIKKFLRDYPTKKLSLEKRILAITFLLHSQFWSFLDECHAI